MVISKNSILTILAILVHSSISATLASFGGSRINGAVSGRIPILDRPPVFMTNPNMPTFGQSETGQPLRRATQAAWPTPNVSPITGPLDDISDTESVSIRGEREQETPDTGAETKTEVVTFNRDYDKYNDYIWIDMSVNSQQVTDFLKVVDTFADKSLNKLELTLILQSTYTSFRITAIKEVNSTKDEKNTTAELANNNNIKLAKMLLVPDYNYEALETLARGNPKAALAISSAFSQNQKNTDQAKIPLIESVAQLRRVNRERSLVQQMDNEYSSVKDFPNLLQKKNIKKDKKQEKKNQEK